MENLAENDNIKKIVEEQVLKFLESFPKRQVAPKKEANTVNLRTSNCRKGYVLVTRGKRPAIPGLEIVTVAKPSFELVEGIVYQLSEDKSTVLEGNLGQQPSWASTKEAETVDKIRAKIANSMKSAPRKPTEMSEEQKTTLQDAEAALAELGLA